MLKYINQPCQLEGKVLIVCGISAGYVPTFALDSLITLNEFKRVAYFHSDYLEPSVGYLPSNIQGGALGMPAQIYVNGDVVILQFRSLVRFGRKKDIAKQVAKFVQQEKLTDVVVIASLPYSIKPDRQIGSLQKNIYYKLNGKLGESIKIGKCAELGYVHSIDLLKQADEEEEIILSNAGISKHLAKQLQNVLILLMFNEQVEDKQTGVYFSKQLFKIIDKKQVSKIK